MFRAALLPVRRLRRTGLRGVVLTLLAVYFGAMLLMQANSPLSQSAGREHHGGGGGGRHYAEFGADQRPAGVDAAAAAARDGVSFRPRVDPQKLFEDIRGQNGRGRPNAAQLTTQRQLLINLLQQAGNEGLNTVKIKESVARDFVQDAAKLPPERDLNTPPHCQSNRSVEGVFLQPLDGVMLLSAFWDERPNDFDNRHNGTYVRLMAVVRGPARPQLVCLWPDLALRTPIAYYEMCENHGRPYGSFILSCMVPDRLASADARPPCHVTIGASESDLGHQPVDVELRTLKPSPGLQIETEWLGDGLYDTTICVPPLFGTVSSAKLIEFFELSYLLGATHIVLYDFNVPESTRRLVEQYSARCRLQRRSCRVDLLPWRLPPDVDAGIWYHGQSVSLQHCLYRQMASSRRVLFADIDEFVVPHAAGVTRWNAMVRRLDRPGRCALQFSSAFFDPGQTPADDRQDLMTMRAVRRSNFNTMRSKCMVRPYEIFEAGIHHISKPIWADLEVFRVPTDEAFLHHYRACVGAFGMDCRGQSDDSTMLRYRDDLQTAVRLAYAELEAVL